MAKTVYTSGELAVINKAILSNPDNSPRVFPISELKQGMAVQYLVVSATEERHDQEGKPLLDGQKMPLKFFKEEAEIDFTSEQKVLISRLVNEHRWSVERYLCICRASTKID